jgi:hypothetical protein
MTATRFRTVRRMTGPLVTRTCTQGDSGFVWMEQVHRSAAGCLGPEQISLLPTVPYARLPIVRSADLALWTGLPSSELLSDRMLSGGLKDNDAYWDLTLTALGRCAAALHEAPPADLPDRSERPAWLADDEVADGVRQARDRLALNLAPSLVEWAGRLLSPVPKTLIHGRFSAGVCVRGSEPVMVGWREAGIGDPGTDLARLGADLVESGCLTQCPPDVLANRIAAFLRGYGPVDMSRLWTLVARRIIDHFALGSWAAGGGAEAGELLRQTENYWLSVCDG